MAPAISKNIREKLIPTTLVLLDLAAQVGQLAPVPYLSQAASLVSEIFKTVQDVQDNKNAFQKLAADADNLLTGLLHSYKTSSNKESWPPRGLKDVLVELESTLQDIKADAEEMTKRHLGKRFLQNKVDPGRVKTYREKLGVCVAKFELQSHISLNEGVSLIMSSQSASNEAQHSLVQAVVLSQSAVHLAAEKSAKEERERKAMDTLSKYVAAGASHDSAARGAVPACHPDTREIVIHEIMGWVKDMKGLAFLWIYGPAGSGKTTIMQTIAKKCEAEHLLAASFFFSRSAANRPKENSQFISTIVDQMCFFIPEMRTHVAVAIDNDPRIFSKTLTKQMEHLIVKPLNRFSEEPHSIVPKALPRLIIVDGLDECEDPDSQTQVIKILAAAAEQLISPLIFLIASRPEHSIRSTFASNIASLTRTIALDTDYQADTDIKTFLMSRFEDIKRSHPARSHLRQKPWPSGADLDYLVKKASGQFIYASVAMKWVASPHHLPQEQLNNLTTSSLTESGAKMPFAQLDALYIHVLDSLHADNLNKAREILCWMIFELPAVSKSLNLADRLLSFPSGASLTALAGLSALVDIAEDLDKSFDKSSDESFHYHKLDDHGRPPRLRFFHASFPDFLLDASRSGRFFLGSLNAHWHTNLARQWIKYYSSENAEGVTIFDMTRAIFHHSSQAALTAELHDDLVNLDLQVFFALIRPEHNREGLALILNFIIWLEHKIFPWDPQINRSLHDQFLRNTQRVIQQHWSMYPPEVRKHFPIALTLQGKDNLHLRGSWISKLYEDLDFDDPIGIIRLLELFDTRATANINKNRDMEQLAGDYNLYSQTKVLLCQILTNFQPMCGGYFKDELQYRELAIILVDALRDIPRTETSRRDSEEAIDFESDTSSQYSESESTSSYSDEETEQFKMHVALALPKCLSKAFLNKELAMHLRDTALQIDLSRFLITWDIYEAFLAMSLASMIYIHESGIPYLNHTHPPKYNTEQWYCAICDAEKWGNDPSLYSVPEGPVEEGPRRGFLLGHLNFNWFLELLRMHVWLIWLMESLKRHFIFY